MASYIQGLTDIPVPVEPFQPDFGMVQKVLSALQSRYEQGFASVKNAYNQVLNAPLTNTALKAQRDAYVKEAEQKLKNLSSVDLSLPENQVAAEQVFSPFWEDSRILTDASLTKGYKNQIARGENARDSPDEKVREQFNDLSMRYLYNGLEQLRDADPNSQEFAKLQPRRWVPFHNLEKYLDEQAKEQGLKIEWKSGNGPYLVKITNGQRALQPFKNWAHNMLGNNFVEQFNVMGTVESEEGVKDVMARNPKLTKQQAVELHAKNVMEQLKQGYEERTTEVGESLRQIEAKMKPLLEKDLSADTDQEEIQELQSLDRQRKALVEQNDTLKKEYDGFTTKAPQTYADIVRNPVGYFANANKQRLVNGWATARASIESMDVDINPVFKESNDNAYNLAKLRYDYDKLALDTRIAESKMIDTDGDGVKDTYVGDSDGSGSDGGSGSGGTRGGGSKPRKGDGSRDDITSGRNMGAGITDITQTGSAMDVFLMEQANRLGRANESFLSQTGVARVLETKLGFGDEESRNFLSEARRALSDPEHSSLTSDARFQPIRAALEKASGMKVDNGLNARDALVKVAGDYLAEKLKGGGKGMTKEDRQMERQYLFGLNALQVYNSSEAAKQQAIEKVFAGTSEFDKLKKTGADGKLDVFGVEDVAQLFSQRQYRFVDWDSGQDFDLSSEQLAQLYADGKIRSRLYDSSSWLTIDGKRVMQKGLVQTKAATFLDGPVYANDVYDGLEKLQERFGYGPDGIGYGSENYKKLNDQLNKKIVPNLPEFESKTGKFGVRYKYDLRSDVDNEFSYRLLSELENADNRIGIYYDGNRGSVDMDKAVLSLLKQGEPGMEKYISAVHINTIGPHGNPVVEFSVLPVKETDKTDITENVGLKELAEKTVSIELNPRASGAITRSIRYNSGFYVFGDLLKGKPFQSDAIMEAAGFKFKVLPDDDRNPSSVTISMERTVFDDKTGRNKVLDPWKSDPIYFADRTPDEVMALIYQYLESHLKGNEEANTRYAQGPKTNVKKGREWL